MEKRSPYENTEFYSGYEETTQTYLNGNEKVEFVSKHDFKALRKKAAILLILMAIPMAVCFAIVFWSVHFFIEIPALGILMRFYHVLGGVAGLA